MRHGGKRFFPRTSRPLRHLHPWHARQQRRQHRAGNGFAQEALESRGQCLRLRVGIRAGGDRQQRPVEALRPQLQRERQAGAQALQVFDTWGGVLSPSMYREFSLRYLQKIAQALPRGEEKTPLILFGKGNGAYLKELAATGAEAVGVDWTVGLGDAARRTGGKVALQGNLDPVTLYAQPDAIRREVGRALDDYAAGNGGSREGHVFNLGHGMSPDMSPDHVAALVSAVHELSAR